MHGIDAFSFYAETATSPFETLKVGIYESVDPSRPPDLGPIREFICSQMSRPGNPVTKRVVRVPLDLHHPVWVSDPDYDPTAHVHSVVLPPPGDADALCAFLGTIMSEQLPRDRPLWGAWLIEGLEDDRVAVALKIHHALADGRTVAEMLHRTHSGDLDDTTPIVTEPVPGRAALVGGAVTDLAKTLVWDLPAYVHAARRVRRQQRATPVDPELARVERPGPAPFTLLNKHAGGATRGVRYETFDLADLKRSARGYGCTLNTLVLGICGEALARYLASVDSAPTHDLIAAMPVADPGDVIHESHVHHDRPNNSVSAPVVSLHQHIEDFGERLRAIQRSSAATVERTQRASGRRFDNLLEFLPGAFSRIMFAALDVQQRQAKHAHANVVISNVRGPGEWLHSPDGRLRLVELLSTGNITDAGHLNITVWSYADNITFTFYFRPDVLADVGRIPAEVRAVVEEVVRTGDDVDALGVDGPRGPGLRTG